MLDEVEDDDAAAGGEIRPGFAQRRDRVQGVVQDCETQTTSTEAERWGGLSMSPRRVVDVGEAVAEGPARGQLDHFGTGVDGDDLFGTLGEQQCERRLPGLPGRR